MNGILKLTYIRMTKLIPVNVKEPLLFKESNGGLHPLEMAAELDSLGLSSVYYRRWVIMSRK